MIVIELIGLNQKNRHGGTPRWADTFMRAKCAEAALKLLNGGAKFHIGYVRGFPQSATRQFVAPQQRRLRPRSC